MELVVALLIAGALLFVAEFYLPGIIAAKFGFLFLVAAVIIGYRRFGPSGGTATLAVAAAIVGVGGFLWVRLFDRTGEAAGIISHSVGVTPPPAHQDLLNQVGETLTPLRPGGTARFGDDRVDVVSDGTPVDSGRAVRVIAVEGHRILVRAV